MSLLSIRLVRLIAPALLAAAFAAPADERADLTRIEDAYADMNDALGAVGLIDSGYAASHAGRDTATLLRESFGRPVSPDALIGDIRRIGD